MAWKSKRFLYKVTAMTLDFLSVYTNTHTYMQINQVTLVQKKEGMCFVCSVLTLISLNVRQGQKRSLEDAMTL